MKILKVSVLLLFAVFFFSCKKTLAPAVKTYLVKESFPGGSYNFVYNTENQLAEVNYIDNTNSSYNKTETFSYNSSGQVSSILTPFSNTVGISRSAYFYNSDGGLDKVQYFTNSGGVETGLYDNLFEYTTGKIIVKRVTFGNTQPEVVSLTDADNNVSETKLYNTQNGDLIQINTYTSYDNMKNYASLLPKSFYNIDIGLNLFSTNNVLGVKTEQNGSVEYGSYTYEYNEDGYPTKMIYVNKTKGGDPWVVYFKYEKK